MIEYLCNREEVDRIEEREQTLLGLLNSFSLQIMEHFDLDRLLNIALKAKFYRTCEILYELRGEYYEIIECYLNSENPLERQRQVFDVVRSILNILYENSSSSGQDSKKRNNSSNNNNNSDMNRLRTFTSMQQLQNNNQRHNSRTQVIEPRDVQLKKLQEKLLKKDVVKQMLTMNPTETIHLLWIEMNINLKHLIKTIKNFKDSTSKRPQLSDEDDDQDEDFGTCKF